MNTKWFQRKSRVAATSALVTAAAAGAFVLGVSSSGSAASASPCSDPVTQYYRALQYQQSANNAALQIQTWRRAADQLDRILASKVARTSHKPLAIMTDLDETVLDNSALLARDLEQCHTYTSWDTWNDWELHGNPTLTAGARWFFAYANSKHVAIYYVSDRYQQNISATLATLNTLGLPQAVASHTLLYTTDANTKAVRRASIEKNHTLLMQFGDQLVDFDGSFKGLTSDQQHVRATQLASHWGRDWIMFPNAAYGKWGSATLNAWNAPVVVGYPQ
ncbi:5'-nucleotidase, lipoprotein e(P4) family [Nocardioides baekrokdamisoli]|uniref:5'-nucleotidase, lipoprotein e(P4) family n=1 Tax=Nocardioides baekrokdamisoli TaxID=1804624 RepID=A0A3G9IBX1_9ACTN|nr:HAD family acid phosphatase [Nocardioides baekrokdamisoli]BBH15786.1 5'-nucleotidase, lipoprotein e(P4) family [Nocardioides baekrokdamisoli]